MGLVKPLLFAAKANSSSKKVVFVVIVDDNEEDYGHHTRAINTWYGSIPNMGRA